MDLPFEDRDPFSFLECSGTVSVPRFSSPHTVSGSGRLLGGADPSFAVPSPPCFELNFLSVSLVLCFGPFSVPVHSFLIKKYGLDLDIRTLFFFFLMLSISPVWLIATAPEIALRSCFLLLSLSRAGSRDVSLFCGEVSPLGTLHFASFLMATEVSMRIMGDSPQAVSDYRLLPPGFFPTLTCLLLEWFPPEREVPP